MNSWKKIAPIAVALLLLAVCVSGQESAKPTPEQRTAMKITIILHESNDKQEIATLPYEVAITAVENRDSRGSGRVGTRIPVLTAKDQFSYVDIGTSYDCSVTVLSDARYRISTNIDRSSLSSFDSKGHSVTPDSPENPRINSLRLAFDVILRDGETQEGSIATDPLTGHVWKVEVRLKVLK